MTAPTPQNDLARTTLGVIAIGALILSSLWILAPFLPATIWATMIVVATWPLMLQCQALLGGRRGAAVAVMTLALLLVFVIPFSLAVGTIVENSDQIAEWGNALTSMSLPPLPQWIADLPLVGERLAAGWSKLSSTDATEMAPRLAPYVGGVLTWLMAQLGGFGVAFAHFVLTVILCAVMYANGETAVAGVIRFARRLADARGEKSVILAGQAIRGVALGVVVTAIVQSVISGLALLIAGTPYAAVLTALVLILCIAQLGPLLVLGPVTAHTFWIGDTAWGIFLAVSLIVVQGLDNVLRPMLIRRGADLPLLLIFAGVIGGLLAVGMVGIFVGPVILAVAYTLLDDWTRSAPEPTKAEAEAEVAMERAAS